jgi:hypothetical protein
MSRPTSCFDNLKPSAGGPKPKKGKAPQIRLTRKPDGTLVGWDDWRVKQNNSRPSVNRPEKRKAKP